MGAIGEGCAVALSLLSCRVGDCAKTTGNAEALMTRARRRLHDAFYRELIVSVTHENNLKASNASIYLSINHMIAIPALSD